MEQYYSDIDIAFNFLDFQRSKIHFTLTNFNKFERIPNTVNETDIVDVAIREVTKLFAWTKAIFVVRQDLLDALLNQCLGCLSNLLVFLHNIVVDLSCQGCGLVWEGCFELRNPNVAAEAPMRTGLLETILPLEPSSVDGHMSKLAFE